MSRLFNLATNFAELFDKFDEIAAWKPDTDADGKPISENGDEICDENAYRDEMFAAWYDTLEGIEGEFNAKAENIGVYIKQLKAEKEAIDAEIKSLRTRSAAKERQMDSLKDYLINCMDEMQLAKIDQPRAKISIRNNAESAQILDEKALIEWAQTHDRDDLLTYHTPDVSKTAVKNAIKSGEEIPGASVGRSRSVVVR